MTHDEINALSLSGNATLIAVLNQMGISYDLSDAFNENWYLRFSMLEGQQKPTQEQIESAFETYKNALHEEEDIRLAEVARVDDINARWAVMTDIRMAIAQAGLTIANPDLELARIINENDQSRLEVLEAAWAEYLPLKSQRDDIEAKIAMGDNDEKCCRDVLRFIGGLNRSRNYTAEQVALMVSTFGTIQSLLIGLRPSSALKLINAITPDGDVVTAEIKENAQWIFAKYGIEPAP